jgi:hypothetical protein
MTTNPGETGKLAETVMKSVELIKSELEKSRSDVSIFKNTVKYLAKKVNRNLDLINENKKNFPIMFMFSAPAHKVFKK